MIDTFSHSAITTYENCPMAFRYRYLEKKPEAFVTIETHMGRVVHGVLHKVYSAPGGVTESTPDVLERLYRELWAEQQPERLHVVRPGVSQEEYFQSGLKMLREFHRRVMRTDGTVSLGLEKDFSLDLAPGIGFRGVVDRIARGSGGRLRVIDYKTGRTGEPLDALQLPAYAVFAFTLTSDDTLELSYEDLREGRTRTALISRDAVPDIRRRLLEAVEMIRSATDFPCRPSALCRWCGFSPDCPGAAGALSPPEPPAGGEADALTGTCPECGAALARREGRFGPFMGCTAFPRCRYTLDLRSDTSGLDGDEVCPECGSALRERRGRHGPFLGCSRYPVCRYSRDLEKKPAGMKKVTK